MEIFQGGGADAFDALEVFELSVGELVGMLFLKLLSVFDDSAGHGRAEVGEGGEVFDRGGIGVEFVL